jgi:hypothetical protein
MDVRELELQLDQLQPNEYVAAVIGIMGTTEEGAVDPIHELSLAQLHFEARVNKSFWIHVDACRDSYGARLPALNGQGPFGAAVQPRAVRQPMSLTPFSYTVGGKRRIFKSFESAPIKAFASL